MKLIEYWDEIPPAHYSLSRIADWAIGVRERKLSKVNRKPATSFTGNIVPFTRLPKKTQEVMAAHKNLKQEAKAK